MIRSNLSEYLFKRSLKNYLKPGQTPLFAKITTDYRDFSHRILIAVIRKLYIFLDSFRAFFKIPFMVSMVLVMGGCTVTPGGRLTYNSDMGTSLEVSFESRGDNQFHSMEVDELIQEADLILKIDIITTEPIYKRTKNGIYCQLAKAKIEEVLKGEYKDETINIYAKNSSLPYQYQAHYEIFDDLIVFLKREDGYFATLNNCYGQMPIYGDQVIGWYRTKEELIDPQKRLNYDDVKKRIKMILGEGMPLEQNEIYY